MGEAGVLTPAKRVPRRPSKKHTHSPYLAVRENKRPKSFGCHLGPPFRVNSWSSGNPIIDTEVGNFQVLVPRTGKFLPWLASVEFPDAPRR
jgi:hypothetical protein